MVKSGVYKLTNEMTGKFYIGSSIDIDRRFLDHKRDLNNKTHVNIILQRSWNKHGEKAFSIIILEECSPEKCFEREQYYLDTLQPYKSVGYNIGKRAGGGDNFTHHPNKEEMREKNRLMSLGENNPMFGQNHTEEAIRKLKNKAKGRFSLEWFIERNGEEIGTQKYQERRQMLAARKINYKYDNGLKGKSRVVESTRGNSVSRGRNALKGRKEEFLVDISNQEISSKQIADKYGISLAAVKYHRKKAKTN
jgi:group I intron endonuclease